MLACLLCHEKNCTHKTKVQKLRGELFMSLTYHCWTVRGYFIINWWFIKNIKITNSSKPNGGMHEPTSSTPLEAQAKSPECALEKSLPGRGTGANAGTRGRWDFRQVVFPHRPISFAVVVYVLCLRSALQCISLWFFKTRISKHSFGLTAYRDALLADSFSHAWTYF